MTLWLITALAAAAAGATGSWATACWWYARPVHAKPNWVGTPGTWPRHLAAQTARGATIAAAISWTIAAALIFAGTTSDPRTPGMLAAIAGVAAGATIATRWQPGPVSKARVAGVGARSETATATAASRTIANHGLIYNSVPVKGLGDIDHVIVTGHGIWTIETKSGKGPIRIERDRLLVGRRHPRNDGTAQARNSARWLSKHLDLPVTGIVMIPDATGSALWNNTPVTGPDHLPATLGRTQNPLDQASLEHAHTALARLHTNTANTTNRPAGGPTHRRRHDR